MEGQRRARPAPRRRARARPPAQAQPDRTTWFRGQPAGPTERGPPHACALPADSRGLPRLRAAAVSALMFPIKFARAGSGSGESPWRRRRRRGRCSGGGCWVCCRAGPGWPRSWGACPTAWAGAGTAGAGEGGPRRGREPWRRRWVRFGRRRAAGLGQSLAGAGERVDGPVRVPSGPGTSVPYAAEGRRGGSESAGPARGGRAALAARLERLLGNPESVALGRGKRNRREPCHAVQGPALWKSTGVSCVNGERGSWSWRADTGQEGAGLRGLLLSLLLKEGKGDSPVCKWISY